MIYKVRIKYWNGWAEDLVWLEKMVMGAKDYVQALQMVFDSFDLEDTDVEEVSVELIE